MLIEKRLTIDNASSLSFLGVNNSNLKPIEERLDVNLVSRGNTFVVQGESNNIEIAEKILFEISSIVKLRGDVNVVDVQNLIDIVTLDRKVVTSAIASDIVLYTKYGAIKAKTTNQKKYIEHVRKNDVVFALGPAGTGKTYLAVAFAVDYLNKGLVQKIVLTRPAVEAGESLGFLPGDIKEKIDPYLRPLYDALFEMMQPEKLKAYLEREIIEIVPLAYMRGRTLSNAFIILDEAQNSTAVQMKMFLTRLGQNSKVVITGDITQIDLPTKATSGLIQAKKIMNNIEGIDFTYFDKQDVVRHKLVKDIIQAYDDYNEMIDEQKSKKNDNEKNTK